MIGAADGKYLTFPFFGEFQSNLPIFIFDYRFGPARLGEFLSPVELAHAAMPNPGRGYRISVSICSNQYHNAISIAFPLLVL